MSLFCQTFCVAMAASMAATAVAAPITLTLKDRAAVAGPSVMLSELVTQDTVSASLSQVALVAAPMPGYRLRLARKDVQALLRKHGINGELRWEGAEQVLVQRQVQGVAANALAEAALEAARHLARPDGAQPRLAAPPEALEVPTGVLRIQARPAKGEPVSLRGEAAVWLDISVDGHWTRSVRVPVQFALPGMVYRVRRVLRPGEALHRGDLEPVEVDYVPPLAWRGDVEALDGTRTATPMRVGQLLLRENLLPADAVQAGDAVRIELRQGAIRIESMGHAATSARDGDTIGVRVAGTTGLLRARIQGGQAVVE